LVNGHFFSIVELLDCSLSFFKSQLEPTSVQTYIEIMT